MQDGTGKPWAFLFLVQNALCGLGYEPAANDEECHSLLAPDAV